VLYPQQPIIRAIYQALTTTPLVTGAATFPVYTTVQLGRDEYVLISQPTLTTGSGSSGCEAWDATLLLSVYTKFAQRSTVSWEPALEIGAQIAERLLHQQLPLNNFSMSPIELVMANTGQSSDDTAVYVQHTMRLRFAVYSDSPMVLAPNAYSLMLSTSIPEGGSVSFATTSGCSLGFNEVPNAAGPPFDTVFIQGGANSFATLTAEYLHRPFAFFDANGTRYDKDLTGNALVFIDGTILI
jgi:hypothetical protein